MVDKLGDRFVVVIVIRDQDSFGGLVGDAEVFDVRCDFADAVRRQSQEPDFLLDVEFVLFFQVVL